MHRVDEHGNQNLTRSHILAIMILRNRITVGGRKSIYQEFFLVTNFTEEFLTCKIRKQTFLWISWCLTVYALDHGIVPAHCAVTQKFLQYKKLVSFSELPLIFLNSDPFGREKISLAL